MPIVSKNILILGETGVGKSTWINGFANFLKYSNFIEAESGNLMTLIPSEFTIYNESFEQVKIIIGEKNEEENQTEGESATQSTKLHKLKYSKNENEFEINLFDTPGIGDSRGIVQDKLNIKNIMDTIMNVEYLHGICILLKPNMSRLTTIFNFCLNEILINLHVECAKNIIFCFTNSRGTFYRPGETLAPLRNILESKSITSLKLNKETIYCFDNEAYRYLAAVNNGVKFHSDEREQFEKSWDQSYKETFRMISYICSLEPHFASKTLALHKTRSLISKFTKPLAEIGKKIQITLDLIKEKKVENKSSTLKSLELTKLLLTQNSELIEREIHHCNIVCSNSSCIVGSGQKINYTTICHEKCSCIPTSDIKFKILNFSPILKCSRFSNAPNNCSHCTHSWNEHLMINHQVEEISKTKVDFGVAGKIALEIGGIFWNNWQISKKNSQVWIYKTEKKKIEAVCAQIAWILKRNSIAYTNDSMIEYLKIQIHEGQNSGQNYLVEILEKMKISYEIEVEIFDKSEENGMKNDDESLDIVVGLVDQLFELKYFGKEIEKDLKGILAEFKEPEKH